MTSSSPSGDSPRASRSGVATETYAEPLKRNMPLIPSDTIAGRALVTVIAIMTFLASIAAGAGMLVNDASRDWMDIVAREMTIQVKPRAGRDIEADVAAAAEVAARGLGAPPDTGAALFAVKRTQWLRTPRKPPGGATRRRRSGAGDGMMSAAPAAPATPPGHVGPAVSAALSRRANTAPSSLWPASM